VVSIFEADDFRPIMELEFTWGDAFEISCDPACTPEQGLEWGASGGLPAEFLISH
jgi:hypothetical protein